MQTLLNKTKILEKKINYAPKYKLYLLNDSIHTKTYVVKIISKVVLLSHEESLQRTLEAHYQGISLLRICDQDYAESCCESLRLNGLRSTIEST